MTRRGTASDHVTGMFAEFAAAVLTQLPRDLDPTVMDGWTTNRSALKDVLRRALCPPTEIGEVKPVAVATIKGDEEPIFSFDLWVKIWTQCGVADAENQLRQLWREPTAGFWDVYVPKGCRPSTVIQVLRDNGVVVYTWYDNPDQAITKNDRNSELGYHIRFRAHVEADPEYANLSANQLAERGVVGITAVERLLLEVAYFLATEGEGDIHQRHLDRDNLTLCIGSRGSGGGVPGVNWSRGSRGVCVYGCHPDLRNGGWRTRSAVTLET